MNLSARIARSVILATQHTPLRGSGNWSAAGTQKSAQDSNPNLPRARVEAEDFESFFRCFAGHDLKAEIPGKDVLDFGSGYGGRTVYYSSKLGANSVCGVEPFERHVETGRDFAREQGVDNVDFRLCDDLTIPCDDAAFDIVLSYDVLEHVLDPRESMKEIHRVLRPGGMAYLAFPPYDSALAHHLDYVTRLPAIHWMFSAPALIEAVNDVLSSPEGQKFGTAIQPNPRLSFRGDKYVLPTLNGMRTSDFLDMAQGFEVILLDRPPILSNRLGSGHGITRTLRTLQKVSEGMADRFSNKLCVVLRKPD